jgi:hypothetical protein
MHKEEIRQSCTVAVFQSEILSYRQEILAFNIEREERLSVFAQQSVKRHPPINGWTIKPERGPARNTMAIWDFVKPRDSRYGDASQ